MASSPSLLSLPDEVLQSVFECLSTLELLRALQHHPPNKAWRNAWHIMPSIDVDLERDVSRHTLLHKRADFTQLLHLIAAHSRDLQTLSLAHFGSALTDDLALPAADDGTTASPLSFHSILHSHCSSITSLSLVGTSLKQLSLGPEFTQLQTLDLSRSRELQDPRLDLSGLTSLDLSRTLLNDLELLRLLPRLPSLRILRLIGCKNIRHIVGDDPAALYGSAGACPQLRIIDLSSTSVIDASVNALTRHCAQLDALYISECFQLRAPRIASASLRTLCLRNCSRLTTRMRIFCPAVEELDLSRTVLKDEHFSGAQGGCIHVPSVRVLLLNACDGIVEPQMRIEAGTIEEEWARMDHSVAPPASAGGSAVAPASSAAPPASSGSRSTLPSQIYPHLVILDLSHNYVLRAPALHALLEMAPNLEVLNLQLCKDIRPRWGEGVAHGLPSAGSADDTREDVFPSSLTKLRELYLRGCFLEDVNIRLLLEHAGATLSVLQLRNCIRMTGRGIRGPVLTDLDLRLTQVTDAILAEILRVENCPNLLTLHVAQCAELVDMVVSHPLLLVLDISNCPGLKSLRVAAPRLHQLDASLNFSLSNVDLRECDNLAYVNLQHSSMAQVMSPLQRPDANARSRPPSPLLLGAASSASSGSSGTSHDFTAVSRPLGAYSTGAYREYRSARTGHSDKNASNHSGVPSASTGSPSRRGLAAPLLGAATSLSLATSSPLKKTRSVVASGATSEAAHSAASSTTQQAYDVLPIHSVVSRAQVLSAVQGHHNRHAVAHTPPRKSSIGDATSGAAGEQGRAAAAAASASAASTSVSSALTLPAPLSSPHRGIRSIDVCIVEERVRALEAKLGAETLRQSQLQALASHAPSAAASSMSSSSASDGARELKDVRVLVYALKKQLAIARAALRKEQAKAQQHEYSRW